MPTVGSLGWALFADSFGFTAGTNKARRGAKDLRGELGGLKTAVGNLNSVLGGLGITLTGAAIAGGLKSMIGGSMEAMDNMAKLSDRLGVTTESLTGLQHAASLAGVDGDQFASSLDKMTKTLGDLRTKGGEGVKTLAKFGLDVNSLSAMSPDQAFLKIADAVARIQSPMERATLATTLFGRQGQELLNTLMQGSEALREQVAEAEQLGISYSRVDAAKIEEANDAWDKMKSAVRGVANEIAIGLAPAIEDMANSLKDFRMVGSQAAKDMPWLFGLSDLPKLVEPTDRAKTLAAHRDKEDRLAAAEQDRIAAGSAAAAANIAPFKQPSMDATFAAMARQREMDKRNAERAAEDRARDVKDLEDSLRTPAEKLRDDAANLLSLFSDSNMSPDTLRRAGDALAKQADALDKPATAQSTAAVRAGSIEALRAQFTGKSVDEKNLEEQKKHTAALGDLKTLLGQIRDTAGIADGSAL